ncbi:hypothetical protein IM40_01525 [Candidatus Paracaedimonas acanthamoebae]|nr:hypothetical protein IM40_01525 [Candidatus Paracaedimonas acanthamoebae]
MTHFLKYSLYLLAFSLHYFISCKASQELDEEKQASYHPSPKTLDLHLSPFPRQTRSYLYKLYKEDHTF